MNTNILQRHYESTDKIMVIIGTFLLLYSFGLAFWYSTWLEVFLVGGLAFGGMLAMTRLAPGTALSRASVGVCFMTITALNIHQARGMIEFHFGIFALMAVLLYYRDWVPILAAVLLVAVHHVGMFFLQTQGIEVYVLENGDRSWWIIVVHAGYAVTEAGALIWLANHSKRDSIQGAEISRVIESITADPGYLTMSERSSAQTPLLKRFNGFIDAVSELVTQTQQANEKISNCSEDTSGITQQIYAGAETNQQETSLIAAAIEEMSATAKNVSDNTAAAAEEVDWVDKNVRDATKMNENTVSAVGKLAEQISVSSEKIKRLYEDSKNISGVLEVIRGVADQTNLLALNAAIEAARAGEQGRGFAVVADEVRGLAKRTQESTREIKEMIEVLQSGSENAVSAMDLSQIQVAECVDNTQQSMKLMLDVSKSTSRINDMNSEIANATREQGQVSQEVSSNISNILRTAEDSLEYAAAGAKSNEILDDLTSELTALLSRFRAQGPPI